ncbi:hypothetical protein [Paenibacillus montanisoli]|uniref:Uncharacterized protein n=1 Tax=Paenibacillus montanisoli TaxID=2081970 RepID=A0A328TWL3_9BACL|nr:hypothetical protein [Paenibacillus montanisoli]RAP73943.1 hypothetical protein DL346_22965 [Paenibacillus montanisoli]
MIPVLFWIFGCYALAAAAVHAVSALTWRRERLVKHYVLVAGNHQLQMEWYMRSLRRFSHFTGTEVKVTVVDRGSEDETMSIARCFARHGMDVHFHSSATPNEQSRLPETLSRPASVKAHEAAGGQSGKGLEGHINGQEGQKEDAGGLSRKVHAHGPSESSPTKWHRFRAKLWKSGERRPSARSGKSKKLDPTNLLWMLQAEGIVSVKDHTVLVDLQNPDDLSKLPF